MTAVRPGLVFSLIVGMTLAPACARRAGEAVLSTAANVEKAAVGRLDYHAEPVASPLPATVVSGLRAEGTMTPPVNRGPAGRDIFRDVNQQPASISMVIRTGVTSIEVQTLDTAIQRVRQLAERVGGYVGNTTTQTGKGQARSATLELKIPAARFDEAVSGLSPLGEIESVNVQAEDVGEEFVDLSARATNGKRLEERLLALLAAKTGKLEEVVSVERELARVREEIERLDGRLVPPIARRHEHAHRHGPRTGNAPAAARRPWRDGPGASSGLAKRR
jgi:hypothetical protein